MTQLNGNSYEVNNKGDDTFELRTTDGTNIDGTGFSTYISGGEVRKKVTTASGLGQLKGETVVILGDGAPQPDQTVSSAGVITLANAASLVHVGLPYLPKLKTLPPAGGSATGTGIGKRKRVYKLVVKFYRSLGLNFGPDDDHLDIFIFRTTSTPTGIPPSLVSGDEDMSFPGDWDRLGQVVLTQPQPLPLNILSIVAFVELVDE